MSRRFTIRVRAKKEADEAAKWYERQRAGLGAELIDELEAVLQRVRDGPELFQIVLRNARHARLKRFPYSVYFTLAGDAVTVVAFLHDHQSRDIHLSERV